MSKFPVDKENHWTAIAKGVRDECDSLNVKVRPELEKLVGAVSCAKREQILSLTATHSTCLRNFRRPFVK